MNNLLVIPWKFIHPSQRKVTKSWNFNVFSNKALKKYTILLKKLSAIGSPISSPSWNSVSYTWDRFSHMKWFKYKVPCNVFIYNLIPAASVPVVPLKVIANNLSFFCICIHPLLSHFMKHQTELYNYQRARQRPAWRV